MPLLDLIRSHLFRALLCTWVFTQQSIWQKSRKWGLRYILTGSMFSQMAYSLPLKICMLFTPPELFWLNSALNKKKMKKPTFCAILMHTSQSTSHTFWCTDFLNRNHGVKVGKDPSGFEDNRTSRFKSHFQEHPMLFPPTLTTAVASWCHYILGDSTKGGQQGTGAGEVQHKSLTAPDVEFPENLKYGTNLEGLSPSLCCWRYMSVPHYWLPTMQSCLKSLCPLNKLVRSRPRSHGQAITEGTTEWSEKHKDEIKEPLLVERGET